MSPAGVNSAHSLHIACHNASPPTLTEADFDRWREARDFTARKYAMWERGELAPSQKPNTLMRCSCGETFDSHDPAGSYVHRIHIYAKQATEGTRR